MTLQKFRRIWELRYLKNLARGQEGGPQAKLPGAYCVIFKDRCSPRTKGIFGTGPYPISFQGGPRNEIKNRVKNQVWSNYLVLKNT